MEITTHFGLQSQTTQLSKEVSCPTVSCSHVQGYHSLWHAFPQQLRKNAVGMAFLQTTIRRCNAPEITGLSFSHFTHCYWWTPGLFPFLIINMFELSGSPHLTWGPDWYHIIRHFNWKDMLTRAGHVDSGSVACASPPCEPCSSCLLSKDTHLTLCRAMLQLATARNCSGHRKTCTQADVLSVTRKIRTPFVFKHSMIHWILQFTLGIAFCYTLHWCTSWEIHRWKLSMVWLGLMASQSTTPIQWTKRLWPKILSRDSSLAWHARSTPGAAGSSTPGSGTWLDTDASRRFPCVAAAGLINYFMFKKPYIFLYFKYMHSVYSSV